MADMPPRLAAIQEESPNQRARMGHGTAWPGAKRSRFTPGRPEIQWNRAPHRLASRMVLASYSIGMADLD